MLLDQYSRCHGQVWNELTFLLLQRGVAVDQRTLCGGNSYEQPRAIKSDRQAERFPAPRMAVSCVHLHKSFWRRVPGGQSRQQPWWRRLGTPGRERRWALEDISLTVQPGEVYGILGPNGSGKSTLIRVVSTLLLPDSGRVSIFGQDAVKADAEVRKMINRVSVEAAFFKKMSASENLLFAAASYGLERESARVEIRRILERIGFDLGRVDSPMENLSRGMQQKVAIARSFLTAPSLLLMDEPTTGLDPVSKREVQALVSDLRRERGTTIVLTTHDLAEAETLCDRVAILDGGRIVAEDTPSGLLSLAGERRRPGGPPVNDLEAAFFTLTGRSLGDDRDEA